eukprot:2722569-Rhodomonas_salina.1
MVLRSPYGPERMVLRSPYGTELAYGATSAGAHACGIFAPGSGALRYPSTRPYALSGTELACCYAVCGTEIAYGATRCA